MATAQENLARFQEISRRGLQDQLDPDKKARFDEAMRRGLITTDQQTPQQPAEIMGDRAARDYGRPRSMMDLVGERERALDEEAQTLDQRLQAGELTGKDLDPQQIARVQRQRTQSIPEITGAVADFAGTDALSNLALLQTFDPYEFGDILRASNPNIGIVTTRDGDVIAVDNQTREAFNINKQGPSLLDALQTGGAVAAFTPASRGATIGAQAARGAGTQAVIEGAQAESGGQIDPENIALEAAIPVAMAKGGEAVKAGINRLRGRSPAAVEATQEVIERKVSPQIGVADDQVNVPRRPFSFNESAKKQEIREAIKQGTKEGAGYRINQKGQVVSDPVARSAVRQGFDERTVSTVKFGSEADRNAMLKMLNMAEESLKSGTARVRNRPQKVIGDTVMDRFNVVLKANKEAGQKVSQAARQNLKGQQVDVSGALDQFSDDLTQLGIDIGEDGLSFAGSQIEGNKATAAIKRVFNRLNAEDDGLQLHRLKQYIDSQINWEKSPDKPLDKQAVNVLKRLRENINTRLRESSDEYAAANNDYRKTVSALNEFSDVMGRRFDPEKERVSDLVGQELRKLLSNYGVRNDMISAIDQLDSVAREFGGEFADDPIHQVVFYSDLEKLLGSFADNSLQGVTEKANLAASAARGDATGIAIEGIRSGVQKALGRNEEKAIREMRKLLQRK